MQTERVQICSRNLLKRGFCASWYHTLDEEASVDNVSVLFARFMLTGELTDIPLLNSAFNTLKNEQQECMFVFMRRHTNQVLGILRSTKPLFSSREHQLLKQLGQGPLWNLPIWTWTEHHHHFEQMMEQQCRARNIKGTCMGMWCYR
jgi:hypothetical protein|tara:strand:+ start:164 stop:604 length:441 start_codon:yes stop_codon:yes gene_type:complete